MDNIRTIIFQAGGEGNRMGKFTKNKPKCLLSYKGKTILENNLTYFEDKKIIIIVDYLSDVLINYVKNILKRNDIIFIKSKDKTTSSGIHDALTHINNDESFIILWSDLYIQSKLSFEFKKDIVIGVTDNFKCRWSFNNDKFIKNTTKENGVFGLFAFKNKKNIEFIDYKKSLVGGNLSNLESDKISIYKFNNVIEFGEYESYSNFINESSKCRFFNEVTIDYKNKTVTKKCINEYYTNLLDNEINWYNFLKDKINFIPKILNFSPLTLNLISGNHPFNKKWSQNEKSLIVNSIINKLKILHSLSKIKSNNSDMDEIYYNKTLDRVNSVKNIIPFFENEFITINKKICKNPFHEKYFSHFSSQIKSLYVPEYSVIHGDPTFSNLLITNDLDTILIDPRGIFGNTKIYGDTNYDWAKLFYSVQGNYDSINSKKFEVSLINDEILLKIESNEFEEFSEMVIKNSGMTEYQMYLHQSLIWFSLTGYVKEDIDSVLYSFYNAVYLWNKII